MSKLERMKELARQADSQVIEPSHIHDGVFLAIDRRKQKLASTKNMVTYCLATAAAFLTSLIALQIYSLDWQMASSCWPEISQHVLFQDSP